MNKDRFDTKEGIEGRLGTYDNLFDVLQERYRLNQGEGGGMTYLSPFVLIGRYFSDMFGQLTRLSRQVFSDEDRANMPLVMTKDEFNELLAQRGIQGWAESSAPTFCLPHPQTACSRCGGSWTMKTCHDIESGGSEFEDLDLTPYAGKTLKEVQEAVDKQTDGERYIAPKSVHSDGSDDDDAQDGDPGITWDYVVRVGEKATVFVYRFYHSSCFAEHQQEEKVEQVEAMRLHLEEMLTELGGFDGVHVTVGVIPQHVIQIFADEDPDWAEEIEGQRGESGAYWNVSTKQGDFGILQLPYLSVDLTETGLTVAEVSPAFAGQMPWDWMLPIGDEEENTLMQLCNVLLKRQVMA